MQQFETMEFETLDLISIPLRIGKTWYILQEATEEAAIAYENAKIQGGSLVGGKVIFNDLAGIEPLLVSMCLIQNTSNDPKKPLPGGFVQLDELKKWPAKVVKPIFNRIKEMSELDPMPSKDVLEKRLARVSKQLEMIDKGDTPGKNSAGATIESIE